MSYDSGARKRAIKAKKIGNNALASAQLALGGGATNSAYYATRAAANNAATSGLIPSWVTCIDVGGYSTEGDCPRHRYMWMPTVNSAWHSLTYMTDTSSRGGYWVYISPEIDIRHFGGVADRFTYESGSINTSTPNQVTVYRGQFKSSDIGRTIGLSTGGAPTNAIFKIDIRMIPYSNRTITINGTVITLVASGATGMQINVSGVTQPVFVSSFLALINSNSATFGCTASAPDQTLPTVNSIWNENVITLTANTPGTAGNAITFSSTCEFWTLFRYGDTFYNGQASGPLITTITSVTGTYNGSQTIGLAAPVQTTATNVNVSGGTDNSTAFLAAISLSGSNNGFLREFGNGMGAIGEYGRRKIVLRQEVSPLNQNNVYGGGIHNAGYGVTSPVLMLSFTRLQIDGTTTLAALPGFPSDRGVIETGNTWAGSGSPDGKVPTESIRIEGPGVVNATDWSTRGVWLRSCQYSFVGNSLRIIGASHKGMEWGDPIARYSSWSNELGSVLIENKALTVNFTGSNYGTNRNDSVGFHCSTFTDNLFTGKVDVVGYRYGVMLDRDATFNNSHVWTWQLGGPQKASYVARGSSCTFIGAESDTPSSQTDTSVGECYALWAINSIVTTFNMWNYTALPGGGVDGETIFVRNEGGVYSTTQPTVTLYQSRTTGARTNRPAIGPGTFKNGNGGIIEGSVRFVGGLTTDTYINTPGFSSQSVEPAGFRNLIDNSTFNIWRTTTDQSIIGAGPVYGPERWKITGNMVGGGRVVRQVKAPTITDPRWPTQWALEIEQTSAPTSGTYNCIAIRLPRRVLFNTNNKVVTFIGNTKLISGTFNINPNITIVQNFGTGGSSTVTTSIGNLNIGEAVFNVIIPSFSTSNTVASDAYLEIQINLPLPANTSATWKYNIMAFEMVMGYLNTNERISAPYDDGEILRTQAYYETGSIYAPTTSAVWIPFHIQKRIVPTVTPSNGTATQITVDGFLWTPASTGAATFTADASL
jgi:hypothetical protein